MHFSRGYSVAVLFHSTTTCRRSASLSNGNSDNAHAGIRRNALEQYFKMFQQPIDGGRLEQVAIVFRLRHQPAIRHLQNHRQVKFRGARFRNRQIAK